LLLLCWPLAFAADAPAPPEADTPPQLFQGLGTHQHPTTTTNDEARQYFDQGIVLTFSFNHEEAIRSFREATRLDPTYTMAYWGIALASGPNYNNPGMTPEQVTDAWTALGKAREYASGVREEDRALIKALATRYVQDPAADRKPLEKAYSDAMLAVAEKYPDHATVQSLTAEALMQLRPWDLWQPDGQPYPDTPKIIAILQHALKLDPNHPLANHLLVHVVEGSPKPELGTEAADRLRTIVPGAGHMIHMPAHIYSRTGRWAEAAEQNRLAIMADASYRELSPKQGIYRLYMSHNHQFLAFACMMLGRSEEAIAAARGMTHIIPEEFAKQNAALPFVDGFLALPLTTLVRFGKWDEVLAEPEPAEYLPVGRTLWHFARGSAKSAKGDVAGAEAELGAFLEARKLVAPEKMVGNNSALVLLGMAENVLAAEIAFRRGEIDKAVDHLGKAVEAEDHLVFDDPPDWSIPVRHTLGAILLKSGRLDEAEKAYREDLVKWPENCWSLHGLAEVLEAKKSPEAAAIKAKAAKAWEMADFSPTVTCFCVADAP